jgi:hypothetical protein
MRKTLTFWVCCTDLTQESGLFLILFSKFQYTCFAASTCFLQFTERLASVWEQMIIYPEYSVTNNI